MRSPANGSRSSALSSYGLKQSNNIFDKALTDVYLSLNFRPTFDNPSIFVKIDPVDPLLKCTVSNHVDDGLGVCTHPPFKEELLAALEKRFGKLTYNAVSTSYTGTNLTRHPSGAVTLDMAGFIIRFIAALGLANIASASSPSTPDLFHPPIDTRPVDKSLYQHIIGCFIYCLKVCHHIRKEVSFLSKKTAAPVMCDLRKCIRVIRFLKGYPNLGPTYYTTDGPILHGHCDASHGVHANGTSQGASFLSIGVDSAPFVSHSDSQSCVALNSMESEYVTVTGVAKRAVSFRRFCSDIGFPQTQPTPIGIDNKPAINLAVAPAVTRKSRHIFLRHHYIRDLIRQGIVRLYHVPTDRQRADLLTKPLGPSTYWPRCHNLLNTSADPTASNT
jgi:hypothetical protein